MDAPETFQGDFSTMWRLGVREPLWHLTWDWWWWLVMIDDPEVVRLTVIFIYILGAVQPLMAIEFALGGALRGAGDTRFPLFDVTTGLLGARCTLAGLFDWLGWSV